MNKDNYILNGRISNIVKHTILTIAIVALSVAGVTLAVTTTWLDTNWISNGRVISAGYMENNFDYLYDEITILGSATSSSDLDTLASLNCTEGQIARNNGGVWECADISDCRNTLSLGASDEPFITKWTVDSSDTSITIPTYSDESYNDGESYSYDIYWEDINDSSRNGNLSGQTGDTTIDFEQDGTYSVEISGEFPRIYFGEYSIHEDYEDYDKIVSIDQWGDIQWSSMRGAFYQASDLKYNATDAPNLSVVTSMNGMFKQASSFNGDISNWDVSSVTDMHNMFYEASSFNQPLDNWNVSSVTNMHAMFANTSFNQPLNNWNVSNVTDMTGMFYKVFFFNQPLDNWDVSSVTNMSWMFSYAYSFNQPLSNWSVSNLTDMKGMFNKATSFNQPLSNWDVSSGTNMSRMFSYADSFNQPLSNWNVSSVTDMSMMFYEASSFNQNLGGWNVSGTTDTTHMFYGSSGSF